MFRSSVVRSIVVLVISGVGLWLLFQSSNPTPETAVRQEVVQLALAPGRQSGSVGNPVADSADSTITQR